MQTRLLKKSRQSGSVLFISLIIAILLGTTMASYLYWVRTQNLLVAESQVWNSALVVAEAGVEEGMAQINVNVGNVGSPNLLDYYASIGSVANGWTGSGTGPYSKPNTIPTGGYSVIVSNDFPPTIYSSGTTTNTLLGQTVTRTVKVKTTTNSLFGVGIAAINNISINGNKLTIDAYDSADLVHFPGGFWNSTNAFARGDVAAPFGVPDIGNGNIHGRVFLRPSGSYTLGPQGLIGDMPATWPTQNGLQGPEWVFYDYNKDFLDVIAPYANGLPATGNSSNAYYLTSGSYYLNGDLTLNNHDELYVANVVSLYVTGNVNAKNGSKITIGPGGTLKLYVGAATGSAVSITFNQVNNSGNANNLQIFGLPTMTSFTLAGNDSFMVSLYAPEANFNLSGGGSGALDYQGAVVASTVTMNGIFNLHYDVNLSRIGAPKGYTLASWKEL